MTTPHIPTCLSALVALLLLPSLSPAAEAPIKKEKLQIVFCFGQSNMVGLADPSNAWYMTQTLVDAPILLVKCSWGNTAIGSAWRPWSLDGVETPAEKANREFWNNKGEEWAKQLGVPFTPNEAPKPTGKMGWCWSLAMPHIEILPHIFLSKNKMKICGCS